MIRICHALVGLLFSSRPALRIAHYSLLVLVLAGCPAESRGAAAVSAEHTTVIVVVGAAGEAEYGTGFIHQAEIWSNACLQGGARETTIGLGTQSSTNDSELIKQTLAVEPKSGPGQLWLVLLGHGTFDGKEARFNLRGPDISPADLASWLHPFKRPIAVIDTASASGPFVASLSATNRVIVTATRSGNEQNFARFGQFLADALTDSQADLDKDGEVSLLEAFLVASRRVSEFYKTEGRLATEHALLDDNGDGLGTSADWFRGLRAVKKPNGNALVDGLLARQFCLVPSQTDRKLTSGQRELRDRLETAVLQLREKKGQMPQAEYYRELERLLLPLAQLDQTN